MKIAILSDIHANFIALQAVCAHIENWEPDFVIVAGDLVNRGPRPAECLNLVLEKQCDKGWLTIRGNHEDYVISRAAPDASRSGPAAEVHRASLWTYEQLNFDISPLADMPNQQSLIGPNDSEVRIVHASMLGNRIGIYPETSDHDLVRKINPAPDVLCVGHTHRPLVRTLNGTLIVNAGSAGLPFDGDTRPSYAQVIWSANCWQAQIERVDYDFQQAASDFFDSGYLEGGGPLVELVQIEHQYACSQLYNWAVRYQKPALEGKITVENSVREYLHERNSHF